MLFRLEPVREIIKSEIFTPQIKKEIKKLLKKLKKYSKRAYKHSVLVANDVYCISKFLNLDSDLRVKLTIAAILHDIGKIQLYDLFLNLCDKSELEIIWENSSKTKKPEEKYYEKLTIKEIIEYFSQFTSNPELFLLDFKQNFWLANGYSNKEYENMTMKKYLESHQNNTIDILNEVRFPAEIILFAATHHSSYYQGKKRNKFIPLNSIIIEIADKYNALIQSEGNRSYKQPKAPFEAVLIIINELNSKLNFLEEKTQDNLFILKAINFYLSKEDFLKSYHIYKDNIINLLKEETTSGEVKQKILNRIKIFIEYFESSYFEEKNKKKYFQIIQELNLIYKEFAIQAK